MSEMGEGAAHKGGSRGGCRSGGASEAEETRRQRRKEKGKKKRRTRVARVSCLVVATATRGPDWGRGGEMGTANNASEEYVSPLTWPSLAAVYG